MRFLQILTGTVALGLFITLLTLPVPTTPVFVNMLLTFGIVTFGTTCFMLIQIERDTK